MTKKAKNFLIAAGFGFIAYRLASTLLKANDEKEAMNDTKFNILAAKIDNIDNYIQCKNENK